MGTCCFCLTIMLFVINLMLFVISYRSEFEIGYKGDKSKNIKTLLTGVFASKTGQLSLGL